MTFFAFSPPIGLQCTSVSHLHTSVSFLKKTNTLKSAKTYIKVRRIIAMGNKRVLISYGVHVDAVAGWLGSYGGEDSTNDISRGRSDIYNER
jgi:hypothetical protein